VAIEPGVDASVDATAGAGDAARNDVTGSA
jgi:hypothetical protein